MTNGGVVKYLDFLSYLSKACKSNSKGVFANFIAKVEINELIYNEAAYSQQQITRFFTCQKIFLLIKYSRIDLANLALRTEHKELQMDVLIMHLEESMELKLTKQDISLFKKEFDNYFLVPLKTLDSKIAHYTSQQSGSQPEFSISQLVIMNRVLEEWDLY